MDLIEEVCTPLTYTDHVYFRSTRVTPSLTLTYASALRSSLSLAAIVSEVAPLMDTTGAGTVLTMTLVLAVPHAPKKLHSKSVTVLMLPAAK